MNVDQQRITQLASALSEQMIGTFQENLEDNGCFILYVNNSNRELEGQPSVELYSSLSEFLMRKYATSNTTSTWSLGLYRHY